ncbi:MAG: ring-cleaving dioxygenase [Beijerinckiaceae bacterium]
MSRTAGIHHITALSGGPKANAEFYNRLLGLRMVKKTVNFDDPGTYHLYYGDETGSPGTAMTFFPWPDARQGTPGRGQAVATSFAAPAGSLPYWRERLAAAGVNGITDGQRFDDTFIAFADGDGAPLEIVERQGMASLAAWTGEGVSADAALRGFHGIALWSRQPEATATVLETLGYVRAGIDSGQIRFSSGTDGVGSVIDLNAEEALPAGLSGRGTVHHVAFRAADDAAQAGMVENLRKLGCQVTEQIDRNYFRSVYFREPGGVLFEIATDTPGFTADEPLESLGGRLMLPPQLEPQRAAIEARLPSLDV